MSNMSNINIEDREFEISLDDLWAFVKKNIIWILIAAVVGAAAGYVVSSTLLAKQYKSTSYIYTPSSSKDLPVSLEDLNLGKSLIDDYIQIMKSKTILMSALDTAQSAAERDGKTLARRYTYSDLLSSLDILNPANSHILQISITTEDPYDSMYLSNAISDEAADQLPVIMDTRAISKYQAAEASFSPESPNNAKNAVIIAFACAALITVILFVRTQLDFTVKTEEDVEKYLGLNTLGIISDTKKPNMFMRGKPRVRKGK